MTKANCALEKAGRKTSLFLDKGKGVRESKDDIVKEKVEQSKQRWYCMLFWNVNCSIPRTCLSGGMSEMEHPRVSLQTLFKIHKDPGIFISTLPLWSERNTCNWRLKGRLKSKPDNKEAAERACSTCGVMKDAGSEVSLALLETSACLEVCHQRGVGVWCGFEQVVVPLLHCLLWCRGQIQT